MKKEKLFGIFLNFWLIGSVVSFIIQFFFSAWVASLSLWDYSAGWQREIALWNIGLLFAIIYVLRMKKVENIKLITPVLIVISLILGTNHLITMLINQKIALIHILGNILNYFIAIFGFYILFTKK